MILRKEEEYIEFLDRLSNSNYCDFLKNETDLSLTCYWAPPKYIIELSFLKHMPNLEKISLNRCTLKNLEYISTLKNLKVLSLADTNVKDLSFLKDSNNIEELNIRGTPARDFSPILNLKNLKHIRTVESKASLILFTRLRCLELFNNERIILNYWRRVSNIRNQYAFGPRLMCIKLTKYKTTWSLYLNKDIYSIKGERDNVMFFISTFICEYGVEKLKEFMDTKFSNNIYFKGDINTIFDEGNNLKGV